MNNCGERLKNGIITENPIFVLMLGMCPTLAVTTSAINGAGHVQYADFHVTKNNSGFCQNAGLYRSCSIICNHCTVSDGRFYSFSL